MKSLLATALALLLFTATVRADDHTDVAPYAVGDQMVPLVLRDQHDDEYKVDGSTRVVLFTTGMKGGGVVREVLDEEEADFLKQNNAIFVSDISGMPGLIAKFIALPRMRGHEYPIVLDHEGDATVRFPSAEDSATIIRLKGLTVEAIEHTQSSDDVRAAVLSAGMPADSAAAASAKAEIMTEPASDATEPAGE